LRAGAAAGVEGFGETCIRRIDQSRIHLDGNSLDYYYR
jgi:hypothetical protein